MELRAHWKRSLGHEPQPGCEDRRPHPGQTLSPHKSPPNGEGVPHPARRGSRRPPELDRKDSAAGRTHRDWARFFHAVTALRDRSAEPRQFPANDQYRRWRRPEDFRPSRRFDLPQVSVAWHRAALPGHRESLPPPTPGSARKLRRRVRLDQRVIQEFRGYFFRLTPEDH